MALAGLSYLLVKYVIPEAPWWGSALTAAQILWLSFLGGLLLAAACVRLTSWHHYRTGVYRCHRCNRVLRGSHIPCVCQPKELPGRSRHRPPPLRHYRKRLKPLSLAYLLLVPVALNVATIAPDRGGDMGFALWAVLCHGLICLMLVMVFRCVEATLELFKVCRRFRLSLAVYIRLATPWAVVSAAALFFVM